MMTPITDVDTAASRLAKQLREQPWYHRTVIAWDAGIGQRLAVYAEGKMRPAGIPETFLGWRVEWRRVTKKEPCPFGSVKP